MEGSVDLTINAFDHREMVPAQFNIFGGLLLSMSSGNIEYEID